MTKNMNRNSRVNNGNNRNNTNSADTNISKSKSVQIYHADAKPVLFALAFNAVALAVIAVGVVLACMYLNDEIKEVDNKVAGIVIGLTDLE